ncbi:hypothetical protein MTP03_42250 [Tsukamurella sp. PLM1]|nr:hypothetical protein MTP03_42250 [Tsukamurella sp. PLM1]
MHRALRAACADAGVAFRAEAVGAPSDLRALDGDVIVCAGAASASLAPELGVRPVKEVVRLRRGGTCLPPRR